MARPEPDHSDLDRPDARAVCALTTLAKLLARQAAREHAALPAEQPIHTDHPDVPTRT